MRLMIPYTVVPSGPGLVVLTLQGPLLLEVDGGLDAQVEPQGLRSQKKKSQL